MDIAVVIRGWWRERRVWVDKGNIEKKRCRRIALTQKVHSPVNAPKGMHLFFGQMVRAANPAVGGNAVGHAGIYFIAAVVLPQPFDIVIVRAPSGIG